KTFVSVNLASVSAPSTYIDCDAEEPNGHLFFKPQIRRVQEVTVPLPRVDLGLCDGCRKCVDFCAFHALAWANGELLVFEELCHGCGGCLMVCPKEALREIHRKIGEVREGTSGRVRVLSGFMDTGEASGVPIIKALLGMKSSKSDNNVFIDCPPGSSCMVSESIKDADYCVLVAEPTLFGAHNLKMVYELVQLYNKPCGAVLNKCLAGDDPSLDYCRAQGIPILAQIPFDEELGFLNSNGKIAVRESERYLMMFQELLQGIEMEVPDAAIGHP
ncbi:MAG: 4Fe-4S binding protein, partial [Eubacteriales bacterium]|nr:4Fe-4S binding protein [Eubacteriales bacterium]